MKKAKILIAVFLVMMIAASMALTSCSNENNNDNNDNSNNSETGDNNGNADNNESQFPVLGTGAISFTVEITNADGTVKTYTVNTDDSTVGDAMVSAGLIPEDAKINGFFTKLDGVSADYGVDQSYWAFYVGDEYAAYGVFEEEAAAGKVYKFVYTQDEPIVDNGDGGETTEEAVG